METLVQAIADNLGWVILGGCFVIGMTLKAATVIFTNASRERSRREIAAYIAEGSVTPEQGERLMRAHVGGKSDPNRHI